MKKKPVCIVREAHGRDGLEANWIVSLASCRFSDLVASGSCDGKIRLWKVSIDFRQLIAITEISCVSEIAYMNRFADGIRERFTFLIRRFVACLRRRTGTSQWSMVEEERREELRAHCPHRL